MKLVPYAKRWYLMASIRAQGFAAAILVGWAQLPTAWQEAIPRWLLVTLTCLVLLIGALGSLVKQEKVSGPQETPKADDPPQQ